MKRTIIMTWTGAAALILLGAGGAPAQSLGDYARSMRKDKTETNAPPTRHYDNDNLPTDQKLSIVGPTETAGNSGGDKAAAAPADTKADAEKKKTGLQSKIDEQKDKVDSLNHEVELQQREYRVHAAEYYSDAGNRLRDPVQFDKDNAKYKAEIEAKQKELDAARQQFDDLQEQGRKAGLRQKDGDTDKGTGDGKDNQNQSPNK